MSTTTIEKPATAEVAPPQPWMVKIVRRQLLLNKRYEKARSQFASAWNDFLASIDEINGTFGTDFSAEQAMAEFEGQYADDAEEDEDEDDEDKD